VSAGAPVMPALARVVDGVVLFDRTALERAAAARRDAYAHAAPFPHVVLDAFLPIEAAERIADEFPPIDGFVADGPEGGNKIGKHDSSARTTIGPFTRGVLAQLSCAPFTDFLEHLTGVAGLVSDPRGVDGALRHFVRGGRLAVHADFNVKGRLGLERRVNLIVYLNRRWPEEYGGALELWNRDMSACVTRVAPVFNRAVVFSPVDDGYHGFPEPLRCPEGESRKSLQLYYYAAPRPWVRPHLTLWRRPSYRGVLRRLRRRLLQT
jgi:hypothetical protein